MKGNYLPHLAARVFGVPLAIQPQKLSVILQAIAPRVGIAEPVMLDGLPAAALAMPSEEPDDVSRFSGAVTPDGIAVIGISGTLVKRTSWLDSESGLQSYESIRGQLLAAREDPQVRGILLDVDSPGGEVGGLFELADEIRAISQEKPCYAIANDEAYSAAYALASSAQRLFVTRTGGVGSIGVIAVHMDQSGFDEKMGRKYTAVYAGAHKNDFSSHEPLSDSARTGLQTEVDRLYEMFVASVAGSRDLKPVLVRNTEAGLYFGERAISCGLADQVGTFDDALAAVTEATRAHRRSRVAASAGTPSTQEASPVEDIQTKSADAPAPLAAPPEPKPNPEIAPAFDAAAIEARIRAEYEEISALCSIAGRPEYLAEALKNKLRPAQVREALLAAKAQESQRSPIDTHVEMKPGNAAVQLNSAANTIATARGISFSQAYVEALKANPALYQQYLAEHSAALRA